MSRRALLIAGALVVAASATAAAVLSARGGPATGPAAGEYRGSEPPPRIRAPDFTLPSYRGGVVSMKAQRGKVVLLSFVDSHCTESCPIVASAMAAALRQLTADERRHVVPILITVQPKLDTPRSIRRFLRARNALALDYLVGPVSRLRPVWKAYGIVPAVDTGSADIHSSDVRVFGRDGIWVSTQHAGVDLSPANLAHDTRTALELS